MNLIGFFSINRVTFLGLTVFRIVLISSLITLLGCGSMPWDEDEKKAEPNWVKYSEVPQVLVPTDRNYKRMTRNRMEEESELQDNAGSLWKMEGQTSYLFTQNQARQEGDALNVKLVQPMLGQAETKVAVIGDLLKELEEEKEKQEQRYNQEPTVDVRGPASAKTDKAANEKKQPKEEPVDMKQIEHIPARIVEKLPDGNFRIRGTQTMNIRKRPFRVHLTGIVRPENFNDQGIDSDKVIDPQLDIVGIRKTRTSDSEETNDNLRM